jgi:hypothetical protein
MRMHAFHRDNVHANTSLRRRQLHHLKTLHPFVDVQWRLTLPNGNVYTFPMVLRFDRCPAIFKTPIHTPTFNAETLRLHRQRLASDARTSHTITLPRIPRRYPRPVHRIRHTTRQSGGFASLTNILYPDRQSDTSTDSNTTPQPPAPVPRFIGPLIPILRTRPITAPLTRLVSGGIRVHFTSGVRFGDELDLSDSQSDTSFSRSTQSFPPAATLALDSPEPSTPESPPATPPDTIILTDLVLAPTSPPTTSPTPIHPQDLQDSPPHHLQDTQDPVTSPTEGNQRQHDTLPANDMHHIPPPPIINHALPTLGNNRRPTTTPNSTPQQVHLCTYNIVSGRGSRLIAAIRALAIMHVDIALFTEVKIHDGIFPCSYLGYNIIATPAPSQHQRGVAIAWKESTGYTVESITINDANMISFQLVSSGHRWLIAAVYLSPNFTGYYCL